MSDHDWSKLPRDMMFEILEWVDDVDVRVAFRLKPRRVAVGNFGELFDAIPKPVIRRYEAVLSLGPIRPTFMNIGPGNNMQRFATSPTYVIHRFADASIHFDDYYREIVQYMPLIAPPAALTNHVQHFYVGKQTDDWLDREWDGTEEHYRTSSYKRVLAPRVTSSDTNAEPSALWRSCVRKPSLRLTSGR